MPQRTMTRSGVVCAGMLLVVWLYCTARVWFPGFPMKVWLFEVTTWVVGARLSLRLVAAHEEVVEVSHKYILAFLAGRDDRRFILGRVNRRDCCVAAVENGNGHAFIKGGIVYHEG